MQNRTQQNNFDSDSETTNEILHDSQFDYYGKKVATSNNKGKISIYEVTESKQTKIAEIKNAHLGSIWSIGWSHPRYGSLLASGGIDKKVNVYKETKQNVWEKVFEYKDHKNSINSVVFAPHEYGLILIACSADGFISYHEYRSNKAIFNSDDNWISVSIDAHAFGATCLSWEPYSKDDSAVRFISGGNDNKLKIWTVSRSKTAVEKMVALEGHTEAVTDVAWFNDVNNKSMIASSGKDNVVFVWSLVEGEWLKAELMNNDCPIVKLNWSQCGNNLAVTLSNYFVYVFKESNEGEWSTHCVINPEGILEYQYPEKVNTDN